MKPQAFSSRWLVCMAVSAVLLVLAGAATPASASDDFCWKDSYGRGAGTVPPSRPADCPAGYTNNGATCGRGLESKPSAGRPALCPERYTNNGATCGRGAKTLAAPSIKATCPAGSDYTGLTCLQNADTIGAPSATPSCPAGYTNTGLTCYSAPDTYDAKSIAASCPVAKGDWYNNGTSCWSNKYGHSMGGGTGPMTCPGGYFQKGAFCYVNCRAGYTNTGETCYNAGSTLSSASMICADGYALNKNDGRCEKSCPDGYKNTGETCYRGPATLDTSHMTCPDSYSLNKLTGRCLVQCAEKYDEDFKSTGETCYRPVSTLGMDKMSCGGVFPNKVDARCFPDCPSGWTRTAENCTKWASTLSGRRMTCNAGEKKDGVRCDPANGCADGQSMDTGLCYKNCRDGYDGVGPVCWAHVHAGWVNCGAGGAAKNSAVCSAVIANQTANSAILIGKGIAAVATAGGSEAASESESAAQNAGKIAALQKQLAEMKAAIAASKAGQLGSKAAVGAASVNTATKYPRQTAGIADTAVNVGEQGNTPTDADVARLTLEIAALGDPTGAASTAAAFTYPKCSDLFK